MFSSAASGQGVDVGCREDEGRSDPESRQASGGGLADQLAPERGTPDAGDTDQYGFTRRSRAGQERELDEVADGEPANVFPKHDIINAHLVPPLLDVLDLYAVPHDRFFRQTRSEPTAASGKGGEGVARPPVNTAW